MVEKVKITGTAITTDIAGDRRRDTEFEIEFPLRDLFAAFALAGLLTNASNEQISEQQAACLAYKCADAALTAREGGE